MPTRLDQIQRVFVLVAELDFASALDTAKRAYGLGRLVLAVVPCLGTDHARHRV